MGRVIYMTIVIFVLYSQCSILAGNRITLEDYTGNLSKSQTIKDNEASKCNLTTSYFCSELKGYPEEQIDKLIKRMLSKDALNLFDSQSMPHIDRQQKDAIDIQMCETNRDVIYPKMMKNLKGEPTMTVQSKNLRQRINVERCSNPNQGCLEMVEVPKLYETYCRQKSSTIRLLAFDPAKVQLYVDDFAYPSCCQCSIRAKPWN